MPNLRENAPGQSKEDLSARQPQENREQKPAETPPWWPPADWVAPFEQKLLSKDAAVAREAQRTLEGFAPRSKELAYLLHSNNPRVRIKAVEHLYRQAEGNDTDALLMLTDMLDDPERKIRAFVAQALSEKGRDIRLISARLVEIIRDPQKDPNTRLQAL
ncbi:MAG: HEAT repeat domain-containing protein, partial [Candidatus Peribacteraceae bacterium]|nr:HEAT repeat domain-containing protein [Candidatus Peribacteraceae bacterium]